MWKFEQRSGRLTLDGALVGIGYAGCGPGKNNPELQNIHNVGPLPCGLYYLNPPMDTEKHGPFVMWLTPDAANEMFGRSDFGIHGDSKAHPGMASNGCVIMARDVRDKVWSSGDRQLQVVSGDEVQNVPGSNSERTV